MKRRALQAVLTLVLLILAHVGVVGAQTSSSPFATEIDRLAAAAEPELIEWRRHLHQHPELSNREFETSKYIAERLRSFGLEPQTNIARTGIVALLSGGRPGPVVALRADMDGLPVREEVNLPFASKAVAESEGQMVGVMHACGHDSHMAILLATARVLTQLRGRLPGTVKFIFQPAEEAPPPTERPAGAELMVKEGVMLNPKVDAVFGLHVWGNIETARLSYRSGPFMAASDRFEILITGRQTHGAMPWLGVDPIVVGAQIINALQTIVSRNVKVTELPAIVTVGQFQAGVSYNIIPDTARLVGTIRTFKDEVQTDIHARVKTIAEATAMASGATAQVTIIRNVPVTSNDPALTARMLPTLERVAPGLVQQSELITGGEDFAYFQRVAPGLFFFLGITPKEQVGGAPQNHSPLFFVDERALLTGVRAMSHLAADYLTSSPK